MHPQFQQLTPTWFNRAYVYTGSIGDFRYRYDRSGGDGQITVSTYSVYCYEVATDVVTRSFPWDENGVEELKAYMQSALEAFEAKRQG